MGWGAEGPGVGGGGVREGRTLPQFWSTQRKPMPSDARWGINHVAQTWGLMIGGRGYGVGGGVPITGS